MTSPYICLARVTMEGLEPTGRYVWRDGVQRPEMRAAPEARACVWSHSAALDVELPRAEAYANREGWTVYVYPANEPEPLERARACALADHKESLSSV